jgi:dTDP-4-amino-4,6-dideoxygalactose transaminase
LIVVPDRIFLSPPDVGPRERELLIAAFDSNWIAPAGPDLALFESAVADRVGRKHAVALSSGTAAIHLGLVTSGVQPGDEVFVSSFTFAGSVNPIQYLGATPVFIDSNVETWNMDPALLRTALHERARSGRLPAAVLVVDLYGQMADMVELQTVCDEFDVPLVEDAAESLGATAWGRPGGSFGPWAAVSFNGNKIITTGGGGAFVTDDAGAADRVRYLSTQARMPVTHYEHEDVGFNYRMSNLLAAVGRGQIENLDAKVARRTEINQLYRSLLGELEGVSFQPIPDWSVPNQWLSCLVFDPVTHGANATTRVMRRLDAHNIESRPLWKPMHLQPVWKGCPAYVSGVSESLFAQGMCVPSGSSLTDAQLQGIVSMIYEALV